MPKMTNLVLGPQESVKKRGEMAVSLNIGNKTVQNQETKEGQIEESMAAIL
ncbi:uncharacterized protein G2W53_008979 [Senna tora]|uniref:Uncharacterized protein n=1 Tax=Senna tora TaxID=362788 RepID=A0A835C9C3_9FABA|nr:uncharacterized protein G2W53_008979 [Senna tora]